MITLITWCPNHAKTLIPIDLRVDENDNQDDNRQAIDETISGDRVPENKTGINLIWANFKKNFGVPPLATCIFSYFL